MAPETDLRQGVAEATRMERGTRISGFQRRALEPAAAAPPTAFEPA